MNMNRQQQQQLQQPSSLLPQQPQQQLPQQQQRPQQIKQQQPNIQYQQKQLQPQPQLEQQQQQQPYVPNPTHGVIDQPFQQQPQQQQQFQQGLPLKAPQILDQQQVNPALALPQQGQHLQGPAQTTPNIIRSNVLPQQLQAARQNPLAQPSQPGGSSKMHVRKVIESQILFFKEQKSLAQKQGKVLDENKWKDTAQRKLQSYHQDSLKTITQSKQPQKEDWMKLCNLPVEELLPQIIEMTAYHQQKTQEIEEKINNYKQKFRFLLEYGQKNPSADCQEQEQLQQPSSLNDSYEAILEESKAEFDRNQKDQLLQQGMLIQGQEYNQQGGQIGEFPDGYLGEGNQQGNYPGQMGVGEVMQAEDQFQSQYL